MGPSLQIFLLTFMGSIVALVGGVVFLFNKKGSQKLEKYSIPFAAGVLLTVSLIGLLPEAVHGLGEGAFIIVLITFVCAYVFEHFLFGIHHHDGGTHVIHYENSVPLVILGDSIHNFVDGIAIAASFFVAPGLGLITAISTLLHEVPHEIGDFGILLKAGWKRKSIIIINVISAATAFLGAIFVLIFTHKEKLIGLFLAVAAGLFLYLGASDFLPHIHEEKGSPKKLVTALLVGVITMLAMFLVVPHSN